MIQKVAEKIVLVMNIKGYIQSNMDVYEYGLQLVLSYLISISMVMIYGVFWQMIIEAIVFIILFGSLRKYTGGYHANTFLACNMSFFMLFISYLYFLQMEMNLNLLTSIALIILVSLCPVSHKNKSISRAEKEEYRRKVQFSLLICIVVIAMLELLESRYFAIMIQLIIIYTAILAILGWIAERKEGK